MIIIWGGTGQAKIVYDILRHQDINLAKEIIAIFDCTPKLKSPIPSVPIWNDKSFDDWYKLMIKKQIKYNPLDQKFIVAIGNPWGKQRLQISQKLIEEEWTPLNVIHPQSYIEDNVKIGEGCQISYDSCILCRSKIGKQFILNTKASVDHECKIGNGCEIGPKATICGNVKIGNNVWIGAHATVLSNLKIGDNSIISAGSVLTKNIGPNIIVGGVPAQKIADRTPEWEAQYKKNRRKAWIQ